MIISAGRAIADAGIRLEREAKYAHWTAGFMLKGSIELTTSSEVLNLGEMSCIILPPDTPYDLEITSKQEQVWMIFDPREHLLESLLPQGGGASTYTVGFQDKGIWKEVRDGLNSLLHWWGSQPPHLALAENAMEKVLLTAAWLHQQQDRAPADPRLSKVISYVSRNLADEITVESMALQAGLSPSRFAHLFKDHMGVTPMSFLESRRMEQARHLLLTTTLPVQQLAFDVGFPNSQHFSTRFRKMTGQSPSAFRRSPRRHHGELHPLRP